MSDRDRHAPIQVRDRPGDIHRLDYDLDGIRLAVVSDLPDVLALVDATYAAFRIADREATEAASADALRFSLIALDRAGRCRLDTPDGRSERLGSTTAGLFGLLEAMVETIVARLHGRGILAAHAGAVAGPGGAIVIAGRSGQGKTTLVLGLVRAGLGLLSAELALFDPADEVIRPSAEEVRSNPRASSAKLRWAISATRQCSKRQHSNSERAVSIRDQPPLTLFTLAQKQAANCR